MGEDMRRGDVTLAILLKRSGALRFAMVAVITAFALFLAETCIRFRQLRSLGIVVALALWGVLLVSWYIQRNNADMAYEQRGFYRALWVWAITDLSVVLAMAPM
jgi:1,4-dihydroxy-2-naphthoate octaprenyltransferase